LIACLIIARVHTHTHHVRTRSHMSRSMWMNIHELFSQNSNSVMHLIMNAYCSAFSAHCTSDKLLVKSLNFFQRTADQVKWFISGNKFSKNKSDTMLKRLGYGLEDRDLTSGTGWDVFSLPLRPDRLWGPPSYPFPGGKATRAWRWPLTYI